MDKLIKLLFTYQGRINRKQFLTGFIAVIALAILLFLLSTLLATISLGAIVPVVNMLGLLISIFIMVSMGLKRLRDLGWPLWVIILSIVPILNLVLLVLFLAMPSKK